METVKPIFPIFDETLVDSIWFGPIQGGDVLAVLMRQPDEPWTLTYRFRYYVDDKAHESEDRKSVWHVAFDDQESICDRTREHVSAAFRTAVRMAGLQPSELRYRVINAQGRAAGEALVAAVGSWGHAKRFGAGGVA